MSKPQSQQKSQDVGHVDLAAMKDSVEKSVTKRSAPRRRSDAATGAKKQQQPTTGAAAAAAGAASISTGADASSGGGGSGSFQPQQHPEKEVVVTPRAPVRVVVTPEKQHLPIGGELHSRSGDPTPVKWRQQHATATTAPPGPLPAMISSLSSQQKEQQQRIQQHQSSFVSVNGTDMGAPLIRPPAVTALSRLSQRALTQQDEQQQQPPGGSSHQASKLSAASEPKSDQSGSRTLGADPIVFQASTALPPVVRMTDDVRAVVAPVPTTTHPAPAAQTRKSDQLQAPAGEGVSGAVKPSANAAAEAKAGASTGAAQKQEQHQQQDSGVSASAVKQRQQPVRPKPLGLEALGLVTTPRSSQPATAMPVGRSAAAAAAMQRSSAYPRATTQPLPQRAAAHTHIPPAAAAAAHAAQPKQQQQVARAGAEKLQASSGTVIPVPPPGPPPVIKDISPAKPSMNSAAAQAQPQGAQPRVMHRRVDSLQQELLAAPQTTYLPQQQQQIEFTRAPAAHYLTPVASIGLDESLSRAITAMQPAAAPPMVFSPLSSTEQQLQGQQLAAPEVWWAHRQEPEFAVAPQPASVEQQPAVYYEQQPQVDQRWVEYAPQPPQMPEQQFIQQPQQQYQSQQSQQQPTYNMNTGQAILNYNVNNNAAAGFGSNEMTTYYPPVYDPYSQQQQQPQYVVQPPVYYDVAPASYYNAGASTAGAYYAPASASGGAMVDGFVWNM